jgi:murein L,D-transpeptidase YcbB/YkuD
VISLRYECTGRRPVHFFLKVCSAAAALTLAAAPFSYARAAPVQTVRPQVLDQSVAAFYRARNNAPLWLTPTAGDAAQQLVQLLNSASLDGLDPQRYQTPELQQALAEAASGKAKAVMRADQMLSDAFVAYARDLRRDPGVGMIYVDSWLRPVQPSPLALLLNASGSKSLPDYVRRMGWMNPIYAELRKALTNHSYASDHEKELIEVNLERARVLPSGPGRYVLVNAAEQRLYAYENGQAVDSMRVVVGKPKNPTPMMAAYIRFASLNPYWYVPPDLATERIAPKVLKQGLRYLDELGYQVMSDWTNDAAIVDPKTVDWKGVADGKVEVMIRQLPGAHNSMGRMKFMFPNSEGVYLHDNPERELFEQAARLYSGGCVRLEDAARLGRWMFGKDLVWEGAGTEERVPLDSPIPVYITYLTAMPNGSSIAFYDDVYGRDGARLATLSGSTGPVANAGK